MLGIQVSICLSGEVDLSRSLKNKIETVMERAEGDCYQSERQVHGERHDPDRLYVV